MAAQSAALITCQQQAVAGPSAAAASTKTDLLMKKLSAAMATIDQLGTQKGSLEAQLLLSAASLAKGHEEVASLKALCDQASSGLPAGDLLVSRVASLEALLTTRGREAEAALAEAAADRASLLALQKNSAETADELRALRENAKQSEERDVRRTQQLQEALQRLEQGDKESTASLEKSETTHQELLLLRAQVSEKTVELAVLTSELQASRDAQSGLQEEYEALKALAEQSVAAGLTGDEASLAARDFYSKQTARLEDLVVKGRRDLEAAEARSAEREGTLTAQRSSIQYLQVGSGSCILLPVTVSRTEYNRVSWRSQWRCVWLYRPS